jgi:K319-like protein/Regulator of Chromosome Condensation (RCC1) repeat protein
MNFVTRMLSVRYFKNIKTYLLIISNIVLLASCGGGDKGTSSSTPPLVINTAPTANISSSDNFEIIGLKESILDGSTSTDTDGTITTYQWSQLSGTSVEILNSAQSTLSFTPGNINDTLTFQLKVTDNDGTSHSTTVNVQVKPYFKQLSAGENHYCAIVAQDSGDDVYCWGNKDFTASPQVTNPTAIYSGAYNNCVIDDNGTQCWGNTLSGINDAPQLINVKKIIINRSYACALDDTGVQCWGDKLNNSLPSVPQLLNPINIVNNLSSDVCAQDDSGIVCWGYDEERLKAKPNLTEVQMLFGSNDERFCASTSSEVICWDYYGQTSQLQLPENNELSSLIIGLDYNCALTDSQQKVACNNKDGNTSYDSYGMFKIPEVKNPRELIGTPASACAIDDSGIVCWGDFYNGQTNPPEFTTTSIITSGLDRSCAIGTLATQENTLQCWGYNQMDMNNIPEYSNPIYLAANDSRSCFIDDNGPLCWGFDLETVFSSYDLTTKKIDLPQDWTNVTAIEPSMNSICAITNNTVKCIGLTDSFGELTIPALSNPTALTAGDTFICAIDNNSVNCWGNIYGHPFDVPTPTLNNPTSLTAEDNHACAIADNQVHCWGSNKNNLLDVPTLVNPTKVVAGPRHSCALDDNGVTCWGENKFGELNVPTLSNPTDITVAYRYSCAKDDNGLVCWGWDGYGNHQMPLKN